MSWLILRWLVTLVCGFYALRVWRDNGAYGIGRLFSLVLLVPVLLVWLIYFMLRLWWLG